MRYPVDRLHAEVAFIAAQLAWGYDDILSLSHSERLRWFEQAKRLSRRPSTSR